MKNFFTVKNLLISIFIISLSYLLYIFIFTDKEIEISYTVFESMVEVEGKNLQVHVLENGRTLHVSRVNSKDKHVVYTVNIPLNSNILDRVVKKDIKLSIDAPKEPFGLFGMILVGIMPVLILIVALVIMSKRQSGGLLEFGKNKAILVDPEDNKIRMDSVVCNPGEHDEAREIIDFLKNTDRYKKAHAKFPKGILLSGPPGVGKTLICKAIAGEANIPFYHIPGSAFDEMLVGVGAGRVRSLFADAKKHHSCIVFIDEIDAVGRSRSSSALSQGNQTLNQLLVEMDGFEDSNVIIIAATNKLDVLDPALIRPGRFDRIVQISLPDVDARIKLFTLFLSKVVRESTIDVEKLARSSTGFSGADIEKMVNEAAIYAARSDRVTITQSDLDRSRDKVLMGEKTPKKMNEQELLKTAYHEAGHAVVAWILRDYHDPIVKVSVIPRTNALGVTVFAPNEDRYSISTIQLKSIIKTLFGGRAAEELIYGKEYVSTGASNDIERATSIARNMVEKWGMSSVGIMKVSGKNDDPSSASINTMTMVDKEVLRILTEAYDYAISALQSHTRQLKMLAEMLVKHETLDHIQVEKIMLGQSIE